MAIHPPTLSSPALLAPVHGSPFWHAVLIVMLLNLWVGIRLPALLQESSIDALLELERRIQGVEHPEAVKVLVFGNSHAVAGLRPPILGPALGLSADDLFSLALPGTSPREMRLLAQRHARRFPNASLAIIAVDEYFLGGDWEIDTRVRMLTRASVAERWRYAAETTPWAQRPATLATLFVPVADFSPVLRSALVAAPTLFAQRLVHERPLQGSKQAVLAAMPYAWGYPPIWENPALVDLPAHRRRFMQRASQEKQASFFLNGSHLTETGLANMEALVRSLEAQGVEVQLVESPYADPLRRALNTHEGTRYARYRQQLGSYLAGAGRPLIRAPGPWGVDAYYDVDHLNETGARRFAAQLASALALEKGR